MPFLYIMPEFPLYSMVAVDYIREHVKGSFYLEKNFPGTTHNIIQQAPHEVAESVKAFIGKNRSVLIYHAIKIFNLGES